jgi:membrane protease YdiL (CAAX protease family)
MSDEPAPTEDPGEPAPPRDAPPRGPSARAEALAIAAGVTVVMTAVLSFAFHPDRAGSPAMLASIGFVYSLLGVGTLLWLRRRGELRDRFRPAAGDVTLGAFTAGVLYGGAHLVAMTFAAHGTPREAWLVRLYLQLGDPMAPGRELIGGIVFVVAALEELVWRGLVMRSLQAAVGHARALVITSALFALAHLPTAYLLRDPRAGLNPLLVAAGLGCSLVWGAIVLRTRRLPPAIFAHALFSWAVFEFPVWRP